MPSEFSYDRMTLPEGPVQIVYPATLSRESVEDLEYIIRGVLNRMERRVKSQCVNETTIEGTVRP